MRLATIPRLADAPVGRRRLVIWLLAALAAPGCGHETAPAHPRVSEPPTVTVVRPEVRNIVRYVEQPSFIESYERTSIYPKVMGYIEKWNVDIGDTVKKGDVLCVLFAPELVEDYATKNATVALDRERVELALRVVKVDEDNVEAAKAKVTEAKAILGKYQAEVDRWDMEVKRLTNQVTRGILDPQILLESTNESKSALAARDAARATIVKDEAELLSRQDELAKARVDVTVARRDLAVAESTARYAKAWMDYLTLTAPYDGVIAARNANTGDFVLPILGDPSSLPGAPHLAAGGTAAPIYVVDRTDVVRVFVDIPEQDADHVKAGTRASVLVEAYRDEPIEGTVTRTSWALNVKSRTLRAEIDLPNTRSEILPGMYAYAEVVIERPEARAVPVAALTYRGNQAFYWSCEDGKARRVEVRTGVSDEDWIEVTDRRVPAARRERAHDRSWTPIDGTEQVILGDLSTLAQGAPVRIAPEASQTAVARANPGAGAMETHAEPRRRSP